MCWKQVQTLDSGYVSTRHIVKQQRPVGENTSLHPVPYVDRLSRMTSVESLSNDPLGLESDQPTLTPVRSKSVIYQPSIEETIIENVPLDSNVEWRVSVDSDLPDLLSPASVSSTPSPKSVRRPLKRSTSVPSMGASFTPRLECRISYNEAEQCLQVDKISAFDLVFSVGNKTFVFVKVTLVPNGKTAFTEAHEISLCPVFQQTLEFSGITQDDIHRATLFIVVISASTQKAEKKKGSFVAELPLKLSELQLEDGAHTVSRTLNTNRRIKRVGCSCELTIRVVHIVSQCIIKLTAGLFPFSSLLAENKNNDQCMRMLVS